MRYSLTDFIIRIFVFIKVMYLSTGTLLKCFSNCIEWMREMQREKKRNSAP